MPTTGALAWRAARAGLLAASLAGWAGTALPLLAAAAPEIRFTSSLDRTEAALGDRVVATYTARVPAGWKLELDALVSPKVEGDAQAGPAFDFAPPVLSRTPGKEAAGTDWSLSAPFTPLVSGELPVLGPRLVLVSPEGEKTPVRPSSLSLKVASRLPAGQKPEEIAPKDDRPVRIPPLGPWFWGTVVVLAAAVAALAAYLIRRRKKPAGSGAPEIPAIPPGPELLAALDGLAARLPSDGDDPRGFYSELTRVTKRYLERQLRLPVLEWTTIETVRRLRDAGWDLPRGIAFSDLLGAADQVKFGRAGSTRDEAARHLARARELYEHVEGVLAAAAASVAAAAVSAPQARRQAPPPVPPARRAGASS
jgi:hypothetical protein